MCWSWISMSGLPSCGDLVLEAVWESFVELLIKSIVIPTGARRVSVEVKGVFDSPA